MKNLKIELGGSTSNFDTFEEAIKFLNSALYYCNTLYIFLPLFEDIVDYATLEDEDIKDMFEDIETFGLDTLKIVQIFE